MTSEPSVCKVLPVPADLTIEVPSSKSYANRLLVLAAIAWENVTLENLPESTDVLRMLDCLRAIGLKVKGDFNQTTISGSFPDCEDTDSTEPIALESGDGGTTNRFLMGLLARGRKVYHLNASGGMVDRPMEELADVLRAMGAKIERGSEDFWYQIQGPLNPEKGEVPVKAVKSTQFATSVALAVADRDVRVVLEDCQTSRDYFGLTNKLVNDFQEEELSWVVPPDSSGLTYPVALGLTMNTGKVRVTNCFRKDEYQADSAFLDIAERMGAAPTFDGQGLLIQAPDQLVSVDNDCTDHPDLVPTLAFVCAQAEGTSYLRNLHSLRHKETDRVEKVMEVLEAFGVEHGLDKESETLIINGPAPLSPAVEYHAPEDHRIIMMAYLFMRVNSGGTIHNAHHVAKSFPHFFQKMEGVPPKERKKKVNPKWVIAFFSSIAVLLAFGLIMRWRSVQFAPLTQDLYFSFSTQKSKELLKDIKTIGANKFYTKAKGKCWGKGWVYACADLVFWMEKKASQAPLRIFFDRMGKCLSDGKSSPPTCHFVAELLRSGGHLGPAFDFFQRACDDEYGLSCFEIARIYAHKHDRRKSKTALVKAFAHSKKDSRQRLAKRLNTDPALRVFRRDPDIKAFFAKSR